MKPKDQGRRQKSEIFPNQLVLTRSQFFSSGACPNLKMRKILLICFVSLFSIGASLAGPGGKECSSGGVGASDCTDAGSISILWGMFELSYENSVSCGSGLYACCNAEGAACYPNPTTTP